MQEQQIDPITPQEFAQKIKAKYPQYKDIDDVELSKRIIEKYPQYKGQVNFDVKKKDDSSPTSQNQELVSESEDTSLGTPQSEIPTIELTNQEAGRQKQRVLPEQTDPKDLPRLQRLGVAPPNSEISRRSRPEGLTPEKLDEYMSMDWGQSQSVFQADLSTETEEIERGQRTVTGKREKPKSEKEEKLNLLSDLLGEPTKGEKSDFRKALEDEVRVKDLELENPYRYYSEFEEGDDVSNSFIENHFGSDYLKNIGIDPVDFDGYLNKKGYRSQFERNLEDGIVSETGETKKTSRILLSLLGLPTPLIPENDTKLSYEMEKFNMLMGYVSEMDNRANRREHLIKEFEEGKPLKNTAIPFTTFDRESIKNYIETELPLFNQVIKDVEKKNQDIYQKHLDGDTGFWYGAGKFVTEAGRGFFDRVEDMAITATGIVSPTTAKQGRYAKLEQELKTPNQRSYSFASGKEIEYDGVTYLVNDDGNIYDTQLKINVTDMFMSPQPLYDKAEKSTKQRTSFSTLGLAIESGNVLGDMAVQVLTTRGFSLAANATTRGGIMVSSMGAQSAMGFSRGLEDTWRLAKQAGLTDDQAGELAHTIAPQTAAWYGVTALLSPQVKAQEAIFGATKDQVLKKAISRYANEGVRGVTEELKKYSKEVGRRALIVAEEGVLKEVPQETIQQSGELYGINPQINERIGSGTLPTEWTADNIKSVLAISTIAGGMPAQFNFSSSSVDRLSAIQAFIGEKKPIQQITGPLVAEGVLTPEQAQEIHNDVEAYQKFSDRIPKNLSQETVLSIVDVFRKIDALEQEKSKLDPVFHSELDGKINTLKSEIEGFISFSRLGDKKIIELKDQAQRQLVAEAEARGETEYSFNDQQITKKAIEIYNAETTEQSQEQEEIEATAKALKDDIDRRRQEAIEERIPLNEIPVKDRKRFKKDPKKYLEEKIKEIESDLLKNPNLDIAPDIYISDLNSLNAINAKYDAEIAALETTPETTEQTQEQKAQTSTPVINTEAEAQAGEYFTRDIGGDQVVYRRNEDGTASIVPDSEAQNILSQPTIDAEIQTETTPTVEETQTANETTPTTDTETDGGVRPGTDGVQQQGTKTDIQPAVEPETSETKTEINKKLSDEFDNTVEEVKDELIIFEDVSENKLANEKLTEKDNIEQEPDVAAIESQAESTDEAQLQEVARKVDEKINQATGVQSKNVSEISTDESRFQGRKGLNEDVVRDIAENWNDADQDPIHVWTDPKTKQTYVLSGHHRLAGAQLAGRETVKIVDRSNDFNEAEAIKFATEDANANRTMETPLERANTLRKKRERGDKKTEIDDFLKREGRNKTFVENLSFLNPKGLVLQAIEAFQNTTDKENQDLIAKIADWIGDARKRNKNLTDAHEKELFDFLNNKDQSKRFTNKADFLSKVNSITSEMFFDANNPLNIARFKNKTEGEAQYDKDVEEQKQKISDLESKKDAIKDRFNNPNNPDFINPSSKEYAEISKRANDLVSKIEDDLKTERRKLFELYKDKGKYQRAGLNQTGLFSEEIETDSPNSDSSSVQERTGTQEQEVNLSADLKIPDFIANIDKAIDKLDQFGKETLGMNFPVAVAKTVLNAMKIAAQTAKTTADVISAGVNALKKTDWYKNLTKGEQKDVSDNFEVYINRLFKTNPEKTRLEIEQEVDGLINEGKTEDEIIDFFNDRREKSIAKDHIERKKQYTQKEAYDKYVQADKEYQQQLRNKKPLKKTLSNIAKGIAKALTDRQFLPKNLFKRAGLRRSRNLMINFAGAKGRSKSEFEKAYRDIYSDRVKLKNGKITYNPLNKKDRNTLDDIIHLKRIIEIEQNREDKGLPPIIHYKNLNKEQAQQVLNEIKDQVGTKKFDNLSKRAEIYFDTFRDLLKAKYDAGLLSKASYESIKDLDYQPRVLMALLTDYNGDVSESGQTRSKQDAGNLSSEQIKSLDEGSANAFVKNSEWLLASALRTGYRNVAQNKVNQMFMKEFANNKQKYQDLQNKIKNNENLTKSEKKFFDAFSEIQSKVKDNPIIDIKDNKPVFLITKTPLNFEKAFYWKDGQRMEFFIEKEMHKQWFDNVNGMFDRAGNVKEVVSWLTGAALVKFFATGNNPTFFLVNTPRDFFFTWNFSGEYSWFLPIGFLQQAVELGKAINEIRKSRYNTGKSLLEKGIEYGLSMEFLSTQGRLKSESIAGKVAESLIGPKTKNIFKDIYGQTTFQKLQTYSELMFRVALMQRSIKESLRRFKIKDIDSITDAVAEQNGYENAQDMVNDIYESAVTSGRSVLDFSQGGWLSKDIEAVKPYANVTIQSGRRMVESFIDKPVETTARVLQSAALISAVTYGAGMMLMSMFRSGLDDEDKEGKYKDMSNAELYLYMLDGLSSYERTNYMHLPHPKLDENGNLQTYRIAKEHTLTQISVYTDWIYSNLLREQAGKDQIDKSIMLDELIWAVNNNFSPVDISDPISLPMEVPVFRAAATYISGYDFFRDQPLVQQRFKQIPEKSEGMGDPNVEDFYKKIGEKYEISPIRTKAFVESIITSPSTNPLVGVLYAGGDIVWSDDKNLSEIAESTKNTIVKSVDKRLRKSTSDFNRSLRKNKETQKIIDDIRHEEEKTRVKTNELIKKYENKEISREDYMKGAIELFPENPKKVFEKHVDLKKRKMVDRNIVDIKYASGVKERAVMVMHRYGNIFEPTPENVKIRAEMKLVGGILTDSFKSEFMKLILESNQ